MKNMLMRLLARKRTEAGMTAGPLFCWTSYRLTTTLIMWEDNTIGMRLTQFREDLSIGVAGHFRNDIDFFVLHVFTSFLVEFCLAAGLTVYASMLTATMTILL
jgi:hypothetical protein